MEFGGNGEIGRVVASPVMKVYGTGLENAIIRHQVMAESIVLDRQPMINPVLIVRAQVRI